MPAMTDPMTALISFQDDIGGSLRDSGVPRHRYRRRKEPSPVIQAKAYAD